MFELNKLERIEGTVLWQDDRVLIRSVGRRLDISRDHGKTFEPKWRLPDSLHRSLLSYSKLGCRLLRLNPKHVAAVEGGWICFDKRAVWFLSEDGEEVEELTTISGSRPLRVVVDENQILYGEYFQNSDLRPISLFQSLDRGKTWSTAFRFDSVRHIHGVFKNPVDASIWVTTGDDDHESAIWRFDSDLTGPERILGGSQQFRSIDLLFWKGSILFASDAPDAQNHIYRLDADRLEPEAVQQIKGPAFHAGIFGDQIIFTTAREPSDFNTWTRTQVWASKDTDNWNCIGEFDKDRWHMKYFQYGQVILPSGPGDDRGFWVSPFATEQDQSSFFVPFERLDS